MSKNGKAARSVLDSLLRKAERAWAQQATRDHAVVFSERPFRPISRSPYERTKPPPMPSCGKPSELAPLPSSGIAELAPMDR